MTTVTYANEVTTIVVPLPAHAPVLGWSEAFVVQGTERVDVTSTLTGTREVTVSIPINTLDPGLCDLRVRAGAVEAQARTVYDGKIRVLRGT